MDRHGRQNPPKHDGHQECHRQAYVEKNLHSSSKAKAQSLASIAMEESHRTGKRRMPPKEDLPNVVPLRVEQEYSLHRHRRENVNLHTGHPRKDGQPPEEQKRLPASSGAVSLALAPDSAHKVARISHEAPFLGWHVSSKKQEKCTWE
eukprot:CAMPEP_0117464562 /NCGR_PEP_ID=MMETSP0784-20121206/4166_1 /TAXON_ID=39447 /ORGANISM="" /LENGTH=147 /DNA_ID=CAMNT_0005258427 /DNA_START=411 /DNA_END=854 /DNA_ORIENTATION=+